MHPEAVCQGSQIPPEEAQTCAIACRHTSSDRFQVWCWQPRDSKVCVPLNGHCIAFSEVKFADGCRHHRQPGRELTVD